MAKTKTTKITKAKKTSSDTGKTETTVKVRMYNQQDLGDCFLLQFAKGDVRQWVWIDFGSYKGGNIDTEKDIAKDIVKTIGNDDVRIVITHQHKDHISGFINAFDEITMLKETAKGKITDKEKVKELWLSFLDSDKSVAGKAIRDVSKKYWDKSSKLSKLAAELATNGTKNAVHDMLDAKKGMDHFLPGEIIAEEQKGGDTYKKLISIAGDIKYLTPGDNFDIPGLEGEIKVYVLGPPTDFDELKSMNPKPGEAVEGLALAKDLDSATDMMMDSLNTLVAPTPEAIAKNKNFPFDSNYYWKLSGMNSLALAPEHPTRLYTDVGQEWRQIEYDWLQDIGRLALHMDNLTNNTSLVLAFELVKSKKVLLFVGDAQIGNWKSWFNVKFKDSDVTADDLLSRTVLYKAGHHSSHNATYKPGLDKMTSEELVIMIPLNQAISDSYHFLMGKPPMIRGYNRVAKGRVVRTDTIFQSPKNIGGTKFPFAKSESDIPGIKIVPEGAENGQKYIEFTVKG